MADLNGKTGNVIKGLTLANLGIAGPKGEDGVGVASITMNEEYELIITLTNGSIYVSPGLKGPKGDSVEYDDTELREMINDRYTKEEVDNMISAIPKFDIEVVDSLPVSQIIYRYAAELGIETDEFRRRYWKALEKRRRSNK